MVRLLYARLHISREVLAEDRANIPLLLPIRIAQEASSIYSVSGVSLPEANYWCLSSAVIEIPTSST
jgi:hypothetical protein